ncbi:hypothetical protein LZ30DRAFT_595779 [Colletotrichum cereale]|nr:hypothetical protein LZ30DRAFT_595779 [Colletotrichum cereale]
MQIPRASPSPLTNRKRSLDELFVDSTPPPSPDRLQRELDRQHEEAQEARRPSPSLLQPDAHSRTQAQESKRRKKLAYRGKPPEHGAQPHSNTNNGDEEGEGDDGHTREQRLSAPPATSSEH